MASTRHDWHVEACRPVRSCSARCEQCQGAHLRGSSPSSSAALLTGTQALPTGCPPQSSL
eukprot:364899-Chlamydomonas_euryale.AAC.41